MFPEACSRSARGQARGKGGEEGSVGERLRITLAWRGRIPSSVAAWVR